MGSRGKIVLVNATPYAWDLVSADVEDMMWEFGETASVVEPCKKPILNYEPSTNTKRSNRHMQDREC